MIEWRWGLAPLTVRDETANNLAEVLDFSAPDLKAKQFTVPAGPFGEICVPSSVDDKWHTLLAMAYGWPVSLP
jgi:phospholipase C